jgi:hypothetical protein
MGVILSLMLIAAGAILRWAVTTDAAGIDLGVTGLILIIVGIIGLIASIVAWANWDARWGWGWGSYGRRSRYDDGPPPP